LTHCSEENIEPKRAVVIGGWGRLGNKKLNMLYSSQNIYYNKEDEPSRLYNTYEMINDVFDPVILEGRGNCKDIDLHGKSILKWTLNKYGMKHMTGLN
jgi:hypothetical protein